MERLREKYAHLPPFRSNQEAYNAWVDLAWQEHEGYFPQEALERRVDQLIGRRGSILVSPDEFNLQGVQPSPNEVWGPKTAPIFLENLPILRYMVTSFGANPDTVDTDGRTALQNAQESGYQDIIDFLD